MKVVINPEANIRELAEILTKLRYHTKYWEERYGAIPRNNKKYWEEKADKWVIENVKKEE